jgi:amylosucrase
VGDVREDDPVARSIDAALASLPSDGRELFQLRVQRWLPDLRAALAALYPAEAAEALEHRLLAAAATAYRDRPADLRRLDQVCTLAPDWFQAPSMLGYAAYADRLGGDLAGLQGQLPYLAELGVTYLHLMPLLLPREGDSDGGYAVADYRSVRPDLGTVDDLRELATAMRGHGMSLVLDLVLNHVAREHAWARAARAGDARYRGYFYIYPDREQPDAFERTLPEVFPDFAPGNFTWEDDLGGWVWTTFNSFQWDVNWTNPEVFAEYTDIVLWLANLGVEVIRLDAIAFLWKRLGTNCQNQPEVHAIAQGLRAVLRIAAPAVLLKAEAIVSPDDLVHYLGRGRHHGKVSDLAYHNTLMVQIWSMLASRDVRLAVQTLRELPPVPSTTAWICYLRCHDDIGWAIDDGDAAAVGLNGFAHRAFLSSFYTGEFPGSFAKGLTFQANPLTRDRRVSGMTASLAGLESAEQAGDTAAVEFAVRRILLAHAIVLGWGGIPVLWMGDEIGLPSDWAWASEPGHHDDNRWSHRPRMNEYRKAERHNAGTVAQRLFTGFRSLVRARSRLVQLHAATQAEVLAADDPGILPVLRVHPEGELLELFNVTEEHRRWPMARLHAQGLVHPHDLLADQRVTDDQYGNVWLAPYQAMWIVNRS